MKKNTKEVLEDQTFIIMNNKPNNDMSPKERRLMELINGAESIDDDEREMAKEIQEIKDKGHIVWIPSD
jgi:hypothetical protein